MNSQPFEHAAASISTRLTRSLSAVDVLILTLSALSPAASVYITGSSILHLSGSGAAVALLAGALIMNIASLLYAELGSAFPRAGGIYPGIAALLGARAGFVTVALTLLTAPVFLAFAALGFADYLRVLMPELSKLDVAWAVLGLAFTLAIFNIRTNAWITSAFLITELIGLAILAGVAAFHPARGLSEVLGHPVVLQAGSLVPTPAATLFVAVIAGSYACAGSGLAINFSEDLRGTGRDVGKVIAIVGLLTVVLVAGPLLLLTLSIPDFRRTLAADAPIPAYLLEVAGPLVAYSTTVAVAFAIVNNIIASMLASSRFLFATGVDDLWPRSISLSLSRLHTRFGSPWVASLILTGVAAAFCLVGQRFLLVILSGEVFTAGLTIAAVVRGRRTGITGVQSFRAPFFPLLPILGFIIVAAFISVDLLDRDTGRPGIVLLGSIAIAAYLYHRIVLSRRQAPTLP